jgi:hypothetical protein
MPLVLGRDFLVSDPELPYAVEDRLPNRNSENFLAQNCVCNIGQCFTALHNEGLPGCVPVEKQYFPTAYVIGVSNKNSAGQGFLLLVLIGKSKLTLKQSINKK